MTFCRNDMLTKWTALFVLALALLPAPCWAGPDVSPSSRSSLAMATAAPGNGLRPADDPRTQDQPVHLTIDTGQAAHVTISRAADLVGRPVTAVTHGLTALPGKLGLPLSFSSLTSGFGMRYHPLLGKVRMHSGVDLAAPTGTPIVATAAGDVGFAGWDGGYGLMVAVDSSGGLQTRYAHMSRLNVARGQRVAAGDVLGFVGSTGLSTGPHLHYEVRIDGRPVRPRLGRRKH